MASIAANKTPLQNVLDLLNGANPGRGFSASNVVLGAPMAGSYPGGFNAAVEMTAIANAGYSGSQTIFYNRLSLAQSSPQAKTDFNITLGQTLSAMLPAVAQQFGLIASELEWDLDITTALPTVSQQTVPARIVVKGNSLTYLPGNQLNFSLKYPLVIDFIITAGSSPETGDAKYPTRGGYGYCDATKNFYTNGFGTVAQQTIDGITLAQAARKPYNTNSGTSIVQFLFSLQPAVARTWLEKVELYDLSQAGQPLVATFLETAAVYYGADITYPATVQWIWQSGVFTPIVGRQYRVRVWKRT